MLNLECQDIDIIELAIDIVQVAKQEGPKLKVTALVYITPCNALMNNWKMELLLLVLKSK